MSIGYLVQTDEVDEMALMQTREGEIRVPGRAVPPEKYRLGALGRVDSLSFSEFKRKTPLEQKILMKEAREEKEAVRSIGDMLRNIVALFRIQQIELKKSLEIGVLNAELLYVNRGGFGGINDLLEKLPKTDLNILYAIGQMIEKASREERFLISLFLPELHQIVNCFDSPRALPPIKTQILRVRGLLEEVGGASPGNLL